MSGGITSNRNIKIFTDIAEQAGRLWGLSGSPKLLAVSENIVYEMNGHILRPHRKSPSHCDSNKC